MDHVKRFWTQISPRLQLFFWIFLIASAIVIYYLSIRVFVQNLINFPDSVFQLMITVWTTLVFVGYTYHRTNELRFNDAISRLVKEMITNTARLMDDSFEEQITKIQEKLKPGDWAGFDKWPYFTNWSSDPTNFYLKYLPTTCYYCILSKKQESYALIADGTL